MFPGSVAYIWHAGTKAGIVQDSLAAMGLLRFNRLPQTLTRASDLLGRVDGSSRPTIDATRLSCSVSGKVRKGACVTNAPSEYGGAQLYER